MGTIQAGVGILSGLPIDDIVSQLIAIDARPLRLAERQVATIQAQRAAFLDLSARLLSLRNSVSRFDERSFFQGRKATSSNENAIVATAAEGAQTGSFTFQVHSLVQAHQLVSRGFTDADRTPVGAGRITIEGGRGRLSEPTSLDRLNGLNGVRAGVIRITDRSGAAIDLDLTSAQTLDDVLGAVNNQSAIGVRASVDGDRLVLTDISGGSGVLSVRDLAGGQAASDLGIAGISAAGASTLTGRDLIALTEDTPLTVLNDGNGVRFDRKKRDDLILTTRDGSTFNLQLHDDLRTETRLDALNNGRGVRLGIIRIAPRAGEGVEVDLSNAETVGDVERLIEEALPEVNVDFSNRSGLTVRLRNPIEPAPNDPPLANFVIEDVDGFAARDLGIVADVAEDSIQGGDVLRFDTIGDVLRAITFGTNGKVVADIGGDGSNGIRLTDTTTGDGTFSVRSPELLDAAGSHVATDLGLVGESSDGTLVSRDLLAGLNTVLVRSINGGAGASLGALDVTLRDGTALSIDLTNIQTVAQVVARINEAHPNLHASVDDSGTGLIVRDSTGGTGSLVIADGEGGSAATDLNLTTNGEVNETRSGNLQRQYISETTRLDSLNHGSGVRRGLFRITDASGRSAVIDLTQGNEVTLGHVIDEINARAADPNDPSSTGLRVVARINDTGDGLLITDFTHPDERVRSLEITEERGGSIAADLNILGEADENRGEIDGSFEVTIDIAGGDTLNDVARKLNDSTAGVSALVIQDGSSLRPYRLALTSNTSGLRGRMVIDAGTTGISFSTLVEPKDALVFLGSSGDGSGVPISSSTNSLSNLIRGVTLDLVSADRRPVTVTVGDDIDGVVEGVRTFTQRFNDVVDRIGELSRFDPETNERGILQGDATVRQVQNRLFDGALRSIPTDDPTFNRLSSIGVTLRNGRLRFDEQVLRSALAADPDAVIALFTQAETGFGRAFDNVMDGLTRNVDGLLARQDTRLGNREELLNDRIGDLQGLLDLKQARLRSQFIAMERSLAALQQQQAALDRFSIIPAGSINFGQS